MSDADRWLERIKSALPHDDEEARAVLYSVVTEIEADARFLNATQTVQQCELPALPSSLTADEARILLLKLMFKLAGSAYEEYEREMAADKTQSHAVSLFHTIEHFVSNCSIT